MKVSKWIIRKHPEDVPWMRWRISTGNHPDAYTGRPTWLSAMAAVAELHELATK